jgi:hypothetical protein
MFAIFWSATGIDLIEAIPKGMHFNSTYIAQNILDEFHANLSGTRTARPILVHIDNASPHRSRETWTYLKEFDFQPAPHPPFSLDLAPADFYLFDTIKGKLRGRSFQDADELMDAI